MACRSFFLRRVRSQLIWWREMLAWRPRTPANDRWSVFRVEEAPASEVAFWDEILERGDARFEREGL